MTFKLFPTASDYYTSAKNWYSEIYESMICSRDRYRLLALVLGVLLTLNISAILLLLPLKHYFYRILTINEQTGEVVQLKELEPGSFTANWAVTRYFINQYIQYRHSYAYEDIARTFNLVLALSDRKIGNDYSIAMVDSNSQSPINVLGKDQYREVKVFGINQLNTNTALVRFKTVTHSRNNPDEAREEHYQAVVKWDYPDAQSNAPDRDKNPLGFKVTYYQTSSVLPEN